MPVTGKLRLMSKCTVEGVILREVINNNRHALSSFYIIVSQMAYESPKTSILM